LAFALLTGDSPLLALRVLILFGGIQFLENNILTPNIVGYNVKISPLFIILSLILAAMLWGIPGMLVVIPFLAMFKIVILNIERFEPYVYLLDTRGTKRHAVTIAKIRNFFLIRKNKKVK
jgi:predicted PurR-regulated permease PerM